MIEINEEEQKLVIRAITRQLFELESAYRRNVNFNKVYADSIVLQIERYVKLYTRLTGSVFVFDSNSLQGLIYGQVKMEFV